MTELEIRKWLITYLSALPEGVGAAFIPEMFLDSFSRRADLIMANGKLAAFEIKSPRDTLDRLKGQLQTYTRFFEQVTVVCAEKHVDGVVAAAPPCVGIWRITRSGNVRVVRPPRYQNILSKPAWLSFLPVVEVQALLRNEGLKAKGARETLIGAAEAVPLEVIRDHVLAYMKQRRQERVSQIINKRAASRSTDSPPSVQDQTERVQKFVQQQVASGPAVVSAIPRTVIR